MAIISIVVLTAFMIFWDVPEMVSAKQWQELAVYAVFLLIGVGSGVALALGFKLPSTARLLELPYHPISVLIDKLLS